MKIFVYGTLKRAFGNHAILRHGGAVYLGRAVTLEKYIMDAHGFPFISPHSSGHPVVGELYDIGDPTAVDGFQPRLTLRNLDRLESNGRMYQRHERSVRMLTDAKGIKPLPRDAGDTHEGVWVYEWLGNMSGSLHWLKEGVLEWEAGQSRWHDRMKAKGLVEQ